METLNVRLFKLIAAGHSVDPPLLEFASQVSLLSGWACLAVLGWAVWRRPGAASHVVVALIIGAAISIIARSIAAALEFPRPFMVGLSPLHLPHGARPGLPSTHASVMFTLAFLLLMRPPLRTAGWLLAGLAALTSWSRIYLGLHFPQDIAAGMLLAALVTAGVLLAERLWHFARRSLRWPASPAEKLLSGNWAGCYLGLFFLALAVLIGLAIPSHISPSFIEEGGPVEAGTIVLYVAAALAVALIRLPALSRLDKLCVAIVLLAFAAREADLHVALFGISILKARFYSTLASPGQIAVALLLLVPIAASFAWLTVRHGRQFLRSPSRWPASITTLAVFIFALILAKSMDRLPSMLRAANVLEDVSERVLRVMAGVEEVMEFSLPVLVLLAVVQGLWSPRASAPSQPSFLDEEGARLTG